MHISDNRKKKEEENPELAELRTMRRRENERNRRQTDPAFKIMKNLRSSVKQALRLYGNGKKTNATTELMGATIEEVVKHLESLWEPWMSWENYGIPKDGQSAWVIDHIKPCASFDLTIVEQQRACFHYTNLQPLEYYTNILKRDKLDWVKNNIEPTKDIE